DSTPTFTGTTEPNAVVNLYTGAILRGTATADGAGVYTVTSSPLADVPYTFTVISTDIAGNTSPASPALSITIDTSAPSVSDVASPTPDGSYGTGAVLDVTVSFSEPVTVTGTPQITLATGGPGTAVDYSSGSGTNTLTFTYTIAAGDNSPDLDYTAINALSGPIQDAAGNAATLTLAAPGTPGSLGANKALVVDTGVDATAPIAGSVNDGPGPDISYQTSTTTIAANWSGFSDPESGIASYEWAVGTAPGATDVQAFVSVGASTSASNSSLTLTSGTTYTVTVRAINGAGLSTTASSDGVRVDDTPPAGGTVNDGPSSDIDWQNYTWQLSSNWTGFTDPESGIFSYEWAIGTSPGATDIQPFVSVGTVTSGANGSLSLAAGLTYYVTVRATNGSGLVSTRSSDGVTVDTVSPGSPTLLTPPDGTSVNAATGVYFDWTAVGGAVSYRFQLDNEPSFSGPLVLDIVTDSIDFNSSVLPVGTYYWRVSAVDGAGNESSPSAAFSFNAVGSTVGSLTVQLGPNSPPASTQLNTAQNLSVIQLRLAASSQEHVRIDSLRVTGTGTGDEAAHISGVRLYHDVNGNGLLDPDIDVLLAGPMTYPVDDGAITFQGLNQVVPAGESRDWIVTYSLAGNAPIGSTVAAGMAAPQDLSARGTTSDLPLLPSGTFPLTGAPVTIVASGSAGGLHITRGGAIPSAGSVAAGEQTVEMLQIMLNTSSVEAVTVTGLVVHAFGSGDDSNHVGNVFIVVDSNANGIFNAGIDTVLDSGIYAADNGTVSFAPNVTIAAGASQQWLVVYDLNGTAPATSAFATEIQPATVGDVIAVGVTSGSAVAPTGNTISSATKTVGTVGIDAGELTITNVPLPPPAPVAPFAHNVPMAAVELTAGGLEGSIVQQLRITATGSGIEPVDVARASLWEDADGDGRLSSADELIASLSSPFAADDGSAAFALTRAIPAGETRVWFVSYDFSGWGGAGHAFQVSFNVGANPPPVLASGASSNQSITPAGGLVVGPLTTLAPLVGSSGRKTSGVCQASVPSSSRGIPLALFVILLGVVMSATARRRLRTR
ncbi:MAG: hypothetical protein HYY16_02545, partial [Planctomycetes bacterium]|nr:hypothetical protein [Planctomycetota bacterium]